ncbi:MAG: hypothetical protein AVDCRST_MAG13-2937, partial [uncultured Solirubrobacteraceae bacterium]
AAAPGRGGPGARGRRGPAEPRGPDRGGRRPGHQAPGPPALDAVGQADRLPADRRALRAHRRHRRGVGPARDVHRAARLGRPRGLLPARRAPAAVLQRV